MSLFLFSFPVKVGSLRFLLEEKALVGLSGDVKSIAASSVAKDDVDDFRIRSFRFPPLFS